MKNDNSDAQADNIPAWLNPIVSGFVAAVVPVIVEKLSGRQHGGLSPAELSDMGRRLSADVSQQVLDRQVNGNEFGEMIRREVSRGVQEVDMPPIKIEYPREQHNYHYVRYAMFFAYLVALGGMADLWSKGVDVVLLKSFGGVLTVVAIVIDWRNYYLYRNEMGKAAWPFGPITLALGCFYVLALMGFVVSRFIP